MNTFYPNSDFAAHFGNFSPNRDWSTTTKIISPHNCIQHIDAMHLCPKLDAKTRMILFFTSARTTQWFFYWLPYLYDSNQFDNPRNSSTQPRVDGLTNSNSSTLKTLAPGSISMKLIRQPDNPTTLARIECQRPQSTKASPCCFINQQQHHHQKQQQQQQQIIIILFNNDRQHFLFLPPPANIVDCPTTTNNKQQQQQHYF